MDQVNYNEFFNININAVAREVMAIQAEARLEQNLKAEQRLSLKPILE